MVANKNIILSSLVKNKWRSTDLLVVLIILLMNIVKVEPVLSQSLRVNGKLTNTGTVRVYNQVNVASDTINGTFEYYGNDQQVQAKSYENLQLKGSGSTKTVSAIEKDINILKSIAVADGVRFNIDTTSTMNLDKLTGRITKEDGLIIGKVKSKADFNTSAPDSSDFGGIGISIRSDAVSPVAIEVLRTSGSSITGSTGYKSISRVYNVNPAVTSGFEGKIFFRYAKDELNNQDSTTLDLWRSVDGNNWRRQRTLKNGSTLERTGKFLQGMWTASDDSHLLGRKNFEFDPDSIYAIGTDSIKGRINKLIVNPFVAQVTDIYGNPIPNARVRFSIESVPAGASGHFLSQTEVLTNSAGQAETYLSIGNLRGKYDVVAKVEHGDTARIAFHGYGDSGINSLVKQSSVSDDSIKQVVGPFIVEALDDLNNPVAYTGLRFNVIPPANSGATKYAVTSADTLTDTLGRARAYVMLGEKAGYYTVEARSVEDNNVVAAFTVKARHGFAALVWKEHVAHHDTIGAVIPEFRYRITDSDTNAVPGRSMSIAFIQPDGTTADSVQIATDTIGLASKGFTFGDKAGKYIIKAVDVNLSGSERYDTCIAMHGKTAKVNQFVVSASDTIGATLLPFGITLADRADNPVDGEYVRYSLLSMPDTLLTHLSADSVMTDSIGRASIRLTLGEKVGTYVIQASSSSISNVSQFNFTARAGVPQRLLAERGQSPIQEEQILLPLSMPFEIRLTDRASNPIPYDTVSFILTEYPATSNGHSLNNLTALTDINGLASTTLTLGDKIGDYKVRVASPRLSMPTEFLAKAKPGIARSLAYRRGSNQEKQILSVIDTAFTVRVTDVGGNPVSGTLVQFAINSKPSNSWGYQIGSDTTWTDSIVTVSTNALGIAESYFKFGSKKGAYNIIATSTSLTDTIRFVLNAKVGAAKTLAHSAGNAQYGQIGDILNPFVVQVSDTGDNLVPGTPVTFTIIQQPDSTGVLSTNTVATDSLGQAETILTLGDRPGRYKVRAFVAGVKDTVFIAEAILLMADVNNDNYRNIGDLTAIIDHIRGYKSLTGPAFYKADMYPIHPDGSTGDGKVDYRDVVVCRDSLLSAGWTPTRDWINEAVVPSFKVGPSASVKGPGSVLLTSAADSCYIQTTHIGSRFSLKNLVQIKGLQAIIYLRQPAILDTTDVIFSRASMMQVNVKSVGKEVSVILWNNNNVPIEPGDEPIFRLPIQLTNNNVDSIKVLMSTGDNNVVSLLNSKSVDIRNSIPRDWMLYQNYPNPFNPSTTIEFDVPEVTGKIPRVAVQIFNILGQKVVTIERGVHDAGRYSVRWDGISENGVRVASGVYFYRLLAGEYASTKKMVMLK